MPISSALQLQILSDLHLETPLIQPLYSSYKINVQADNIFLLGDIGLCKDDGLYTFLERLLNTDATIKIFYVMGNHESYQLTVEVALKKMQEFVQKMEWSYGDRFILLNRRRYDLSSSVTVLGCTLWSQIMPHQAVEVRVRLTDFNESRGIRGRTIDQHNEAHKLDLKWLNEQVHMLSEHEPHRQVIIVTHHSPTIDARATDTKHVSNSISSGYATDLSEQVCWTASNVKMWAFGHTHYTFHYHDDVGKLVIAHQKGYSRPGSTTARQLPATVIDTNPELYTVTKVAPAPKIKQEVAASSHGQAKAQNQTSTPKDEQLSKSSFRGLLKRVLGR